MRRMTDAKESSMEQLVQKGGKKTKSGWHRAP